MSDVSTYPNPNLPPSAPDDEVTQPDPPLAIESEPEEPGPVVTTAIVQLHLEQGVLVVADSAVFDETHWKSPHSQNVQSGWAIDITGRNAKDVCHRVAATWKKEELVDGTWRITVSNDNEARNLRDKVVDLVQTNPEMDAIATVAPKDCSITRIRDAARGVGAAGLVLGGSGGRQIVGVGAKRHTVLNARITYEDGIAKKIEIPLP